MIKFLKILFVLLIVLLNTVNAQISTKEVYELLDKYEIKNKDGAIRVAIHESNWFRSRRAVQDNNIFGFLVGKHIFESYDEAILAYKRRVESRLRVDENFYSFLKRIKYAADPKYIWKLKQIKYDKKI